MWEGNKGEGTKNFVLTGQQIFSDETFKPCLPTNGSKGWQAFSGATKYFLQMNS